MSTPITTKSVIGAVVGLAFLGLTIYVAAWAWNKGKAKATPTA